MTGFLDGITVLDLASVGPAARASRWLADYGASVVKIAPLDSGVQLQPAFHTYSAGRGMQRVCMDLKGAAGVAAFLRLAGSADVVIESFRPGVVDRLGIGYEAVKAIAPRVVYCSTSGFGQTGPRSQWAGHDLNYLAVSGFLASSGRGYNDKPPVPGATVADSAGGGMHAVMSILAALVSRSSSGEGAYLDVSIADGVLGVMALSLDSHLATGEISGLLSGEFACYDTYRTSDGKWLAVAAIENKFWANLISLLELDREFVQTQMVAAAQPKIKIALGAAFGHRTRDEWVALLSPADTCVAPILEISEVVQDEQYEARSLFVHATHPAAAEPFGQVAPTFAGMERTSQVEGKDMTQTDTDEVLTKAGFTPEQISELRAEGAVA